MKFRVERDALADAVAWAARSLSTRPTIPVLAGLLLDVTDSTLSVSGFDLEASTQVDVEVATSTPGTALVSGRLLADISRALPPHPVDVAVEGARLTIACGSARFTLPTMPVEDYPKLPQMPTTAGTVDAGTFASAVGQVAVAAGRDDTLPMLTGIRIEIDGDRLTLAATDRFRLAVRELGWRPDRAELSTAVLVPARTLADAAKTLGGAKEVTVALGDGLLGLEAGDRRTTVRLLDVEFVKYRSLLPTSHTTSVDVPVSALAESIKRVALVTDRGHHLRLQVGSGSLTLTAGGDDEGRAEEDLPAEVDGDELLIAFNPTYLLDGLGVVHADTVRISFTTSARPALLVPVDQGESDAGSNGGSPDVDADGVGDATPAYRYLVMPARLPG